MFVFDANVAVAEPAVKGRVLGVDDDAVARFFLEQGLGDAGFSASMVSSVDEAEELLMSHPPGTFECVVTDHQMPGRSGLELMAFLAEFDASVASIMIAGAGEKSLVAETLRSGAIDYLDKPYSQEALESAVSKAVHLTRRRRALAQTEAETAAVGEVQRRLQAGGSASLPGGVRFCHLPMRAAGGDFLNVYRTPQGQLLVLGADVSGHDLKSAFVSAYFQGIVRGMIEKGTAIDEILAFFNRCLLSDWMDRTASEVELPTSLALCAALIEPDDSAALLFGSGSPDPHIIDAQGTVSPGGVGGGPPIGWFPNQRPASRRTALPSRGWIVMWTDGLEEHAGNLQASPWSLAYALLDRNTSAHNHTAIDRATDDILVTAIPLGGTVLADGFPISDDLISGERVSEIDSLQRFWQRSLTLALPSLHADRQTEILLCLREAVINALVHGCAQRPDRFASVRIRHLKRQERLICQIEDPGDGHAFPWREYRERAADELLTEHRGLSLIRAFSTEVRSERNGAHLTLEFQLN
ncbi:MAG: SpoIIE family protein phosphatase [Verrucomicrobiales bacterium]|nr:SpoIIE family protein phosphatase [Verrucomicrobiales bacterium]